MSAHMMPPFEGVGSLVDFARRDSYWEHHAQLLEKQITHMGERILGLQDELGHARAHNARMQEEVREWMKLAARYGTETRLERTRRHTLRGEVEIDRDMIAMQGEEVIKYCIVDLAKRMQKEVRPKSAPPADRDQG